MISARMLPAGLLPDVQRGTELKWGGVQRGGDRGRPCVAADHVGAAAVRLVLKMRPGQRISVLVSQRIYLSKFKFETYQDRNRYAAGTRSGGTTVKTAPAGAGTYLHGRTPCAASISIDDQCKMSAELAQG